ncbi:MAG: hypothetical protein AAF488_05615 [Planctomycetota bacterium]
MTDDAPPPSPISVALSLSSAKDERHGTLQTPGCNDCTICRVIDAVRESDGFPAEYQLPAAPFSDDPLHLNIVGLRKPDSISNAFDDYIVVFYRPVDVEAGKVLDVDVVGEKVSVDAIEEFLADRSQLRNLRLQKKPDLLPGIESQSAESKPCRLHLGWNLRVFAMTTEPGFDKKKGYGSNRQYPAKSVALSADRSAGVIGNRRAILQPGVYENSWRFYLHHWSKLGGYPALTQAKAIDIRRACRGDYLLEHVQRDAKNWERSWKRAARSSAKKTRALEKKYEAELAEYEAWQEYVAAHDLWVAEGETGPAPTKPKKKRSERPVKPEPALEDPDESGWLADYLKQLLANNLSLQQGMNQGRDKLLEIREEHLEGTQRPLADLRVDYQVETVVRRGKKRPKLTIESISADAGGGNWATLADLDIVVVQDNDIAGINIHRSGRSSKNVFNWSEGCQVFQNSADFSEFRSLCSLSKRARCEKRRNGQCPSIGNPISADDLIFHYYAAKSWTPRQEDLRRRNSSDPDAFLREKLEAGAADDEFVSMLEERVDPLTIGSPSAKGPLHSTWTRSRSTGWSDYRTRAKQLESDVQRVFDEHLVPETADPAIRKTWWKAMGRSLVKKLSAAALHDVNSDAKLSATIESTTETIFQELQAKAEERGKSMSSKAAAARRRTAARKAQLDEGVRAEWVATEAASVEAHLDVLSFDLDTITAEVAYDLDVMIARIRERLTDKAKSMVRAGFEVCDLFLECESRFSYVLGAPAQPDLDAVLERFSSK